MKKEIKILFKIQAVLKRCGYFDISRISREVLEYINEKNISIESVLKEIESGKPWEYICNKASFRDKTFFVNEDVLIPRVETEQIVEIAKDNLDGIKNIVDVGTGSGCIIISLYKELGNKFNYIGIDISDKAISIAKRNDTDGYIKFVKGDLLDNIELNTPTLYIANLPYIPKEMYENLDRSVKDFEPKIALSGGVDGLKYYKKLIKQIKNVNSILIMEVEPSTIPKLKDFTHNLDLHIYKDIFGRERFIRLIPSPQV
ncbi:MAG: peptide chain release factor N(5)-glutamine methyltransferase [Candidatus Dojkabacteria bacterium]|nr:peptide chain release factor N(5)-glutamine methyltransferase [Candidatus Dojkabacteria bacterium]